MTSMMRVPMFTVVVLSAASAGIDSDTRKGATESPSADSARQPVQQIIGGHIPSMMVSVAAKLWIADHLRDGPKTVSELARLTRTHEDSLCRLLRALSELGLFTEEPAERW